MWMSIREIMQYCTELTFILDLVLTVMDNLKLFELSCSRCFVSINCFVIRHGDLFITIMHTI